MAESGLGRKDSSRLGPFSQSPSSPSAPFPSLDRSPPPSFLFLFRPPPRRSHAYIPAVSRSMVSLLSTSSVLFYLYHNSEAPAPTQSSGFALVSLPRRSNLRQLHSFLNTFQLLLLRNSLSSESEEHNLLPDSKQAIPSDAHRTIAQSSSSVLRLSSRPPSL